MKRQVLMTLGALALSVLLGACASFGLQPPKSFEDHIANAYSTLSAARDTSTVLAQHGKLTKEDFEDVIRQCDEARKSIELARALYATNVAAGHQKLDSVISILNALNAYLEKRNRDVAEPTDSSGATINERRRRAIGLDNPNQPAHEGERVSLFAAAGGSGGSDYQ
jgi:outer membrane murein-binding lipoprotein Lpp